MHLLDFQWSQDLDWKLFLRLKKGLFENICPQMVRGYFKNAICSALRVLGLGVQNPAAPVPHPELLEGSRQKVVFQLQEDP